MKIIKPYDRHEDRRRVITAWRQSGLECFIPALEHPIKTFYYRMIEGAWLTVIESDLPRLFLLAEGEITAYFQGDSGKGKLRCVAPQMLILEGGELCAFKGKDTTSIIEFKPTFNTDFGYVCSSGGIGWEKTVLSASLGPVLNGEGEIKELVVSGDLSDPIELGNHSHPYSELYLLAQGRCEVTTWNSIEERKIISFVAPATIFIESGEEHLFVCEPGTRLIGLMPEPFSQDNLIPAKHLSA